tara:strand:- start:1713 stop:1952 length:240 start_codon:yes stop_codon:yes gene_type:complete
MELVESITSQDADLGSTFISSKEVTINFKAEDLKNLLAIQMIQRENIGETKQVLDEEEFDTLVELLDIILEGVTNYDLV